MSKRQALEVLGKVPLFEGLSRKDLDRIFRETEEETFSSGTEIVKEGQKTGRFYILLEGKVNVSVGGRKRGTLHGGDFFGEMSLLDGQPRSATITADGFVKARSIAPWSFLALLEENWPLAQKVLASLSQRVRGLEKSLGH